jgi:hypothetical protein
VNGTFAVTGTEATYMNYAGNTALRDREPLFGEDRPADRFRPELVERARARIAAGYYEWSSELDLAIDRMLGTGLGDTLEPLPATEISSGRAVTHQRADAVRVIVRRCVDAP